MGILDDAIRQHLELKRQHGAEDEDLERLEKEAFGPAVRPGDPGYETGESPIEPSPESEASDEPATGEEPSAEQAAAEATAPSAEATLPEMPALSEEEEPAAEAPATESPSEEAPAAEEPPSGSFGIFDAESEFGAESEEIPSGLSPAEQARVEHSHLEDTADHPAPTQLGPEDEAEEPPSAAAPADAPESAEQPAAPAEPESEEQPAAPPEPESAEQPVTPEAPESDIFGADDDFGLSDADLSLDEERGSGAKPAAEGAEGEDGEDLLEETPDFLQESEGEDLWFEQGPPRDFDFDDD
ncbi:MAG: hypothetical protein U0R24_00730 [Solirubrobacterales bacterium]